MVETVVSPESDRIPDALLKCHWEIYQTPAYPGPAFLNTSLRDVKGRMSVLDFRQSPFSSLRSIGTDPVMKLITGVHTELGRREGH